VLVKDVEVIACKKHHLHQLQGRQNWCPPAPISAVRTCRTSGLFASRKPDVAHHGASAPDSARLYQLRGDRSTQSGNWKAAIITYRGTIERDPHLSGIHFQFAEVLSISPDPAQRAQASNAKPLMTIRATKNPNAVLAISTHKDPTFPQHCSIPASPSVFNPTIPTPTKDTP
jgi:hypothetical protein